MEAAGATVLQNEKPKELGQQNINLQLVSSLAGVRKAKELGAEYVLKTRTDQRMYGPNAMEFLWSALQAFPLKETSQQKKRIVGVSLNSFKYRQYGISDMNIFGSVEDMERYWSAPHDALGDDTTGPKSLPVHLPEVYLVASFLKTIGRELAWNLEDSWEAIVDHFVIVDKESLDLYWYKYARMREYKYSQYKGMTNSFELGFREWLNVYMQKGKHALPAEGAMKIVIK